MQCTENMNTEKILRDTVVTVVRPWSTCTQSKSSLAARLGLDLTPESQDLPHWAHVDTHHPTSPTLDY